MKKGTKIWLIIVLILVLAGEMCIRDRSEALKERLKGASIHQEIFGSDHCPVELELEAEELSLIHI